MFEKQCCFCLTRTLFLDRRSLSIRVLHFMVHVEFPWGFLKAIFLARTDITLSDFSENIAYFVPWRAIYYIFTASPNRRPITLVLSAALVAGGTKIQQTEMEISMLAGHALG